MFKKRISKVFLILFLGFLITPTTILIADSSIDVSMFYSLTEEKEEKVNEKNIEIELLFNEIDVNEMAFENDIIQNKTDYLFKKYSIPHLNLISPPPDLFYF